MSTFLTGATGYIGSYVATRLMQHHDEPLVLLVRGRTRGEAEHKLWKALQLHWDFPTFRRHLDSHVEILLGDVTRPRLGLQAERWRRLVAGTDSIVHAAASLNRMSARLCFDVNLRGTLEVIELAREIQALGGLRRLSFVSTVAVAGQRDREVVTEDEAIDFGRRDYDPYAGTKKFCEHMLERLLPDVPRTVFRPSIVMGDTRFGATTQFDMVRATAILARMRVIPLSPGGRIDIVPADYVGHAIADLHVGEPRHGIYHLSAGEGTERNVEVMQRLRLYGKPLAFRFEPRLMGAFGRGASLFAATPRNWPTSGVGALLKGFWPYVTFDTVFDNRRVVEALGARPVPFSSFAGPLLEFAIEHGFEYPYRPFPLVGVESREAAE